MLQSICLAVKLATLGALHGVSVGDWVKVTRPDRSVAFYTPVQLHGGTGPYLGLQVSLVRRGGARCLVERLPHLRVSRYTAIDSMSLSADCPGRYALRSGNAEPENALNVDLIGWHTTRRVRDEQRQAYGLN